MPSNSPRAYAFEVSIKRATRGGDCEDMAVGGRRRAGLNCEARKLHNLATGESGFMGTETHTSPVRRLAGIGKRIAVLHQCAHKFVHQVWVASAVAGSLRET